MEGFDLLTISMVFVAACVTMTIGVWLHLKLKIGDHSSHPGPISNGYHPPEQRRPMQAGDWFNATINMVLGVLLGVAVDGLAQLVTTAFWPVAVTIPLMFIGILLFDGWLNRLVEKVFPSGVRPGRKTQAKSRLPLPRLLSLPVGLVIGVGLARLGLGGTFMGMIS